MLFEGHCEESRPHQADLEGQSNLQIPGVNYGIGYIYCEILYIIGRENVLTIRNVMRASSLCFL